MSSPSVAVVSPTYFGADSVVGGGERYAVEFAQELAKRCHTRLLSFGTEKRQEKRGNLELEFFRCKHLLKGNKLNPLHFSFLRKLRGFDIIHLHGISTLVSDLSLIAGFLQKSKVYVTDHGGGGEIILNNKLPLFKAYTGAVAQSQFAQECLPEELKRKSKVILGGVDLNRFFPDPSTPKQKIILSVGRILPHKGLDVLIKGMKLWGNSDWKLRVIGRISHQPFYQHLLELCEGLKVDWCHEADDQELIRSYREAAVCVLASVKKDCYGGVVKAPELMGFTLMESQACGTPVIHSDAGAMEEFVNEKVTGWEVKQSSPESMAEALQRAATHHIENQVESSKACRAWIQQFGWKSVIDQHLDFYRE